MKKIATAALISAAFAAPAFAEDQGVYVGLNVGQGNVSTAGAGWSKSSDTIFGGLVGYQINRNFAVEGQFTGTGKATDVAGNTLKADALSVTAVGILPLNDAFSLYGKLGVASVASTSSSAAAFGANATQTSATYGVGAQYNVTPTIGLRAGYDAYKAKTTLQNFDTNTLTVGAVFKF